MRTRRHRERLDDIPTTTTPKKRVRLRLEDPDHLTLLDAFSDPRLFAKFFKDPESWLAWTALIAAAFGLPMSADQLAIYRKCTGRTDPPVEQMRELVLVVGRRGGKSRVLALIATWLSAFVDYKPYLDPGERGVVQVLAADRDQAKIILRYVKAFFKLPMLAKLIERETQFGLDLTNSVAIEVTTASFRSVRGRTVVAALADEIAFWNDEGANPDAEVIKAIRPSMATIPNAMLLLASSPYARKGVLWDMHRQYHGKDDPRVLSWQAATEVMNPSIDPKWLTEQYERDPVSASAEYGAQFRTDVEAFIAAEAVDAVTSDERERPYIAGKRYYAFADPAGGSGKDSFTLAIGHVEDRIPTLDVIREFKPPFSPKAVIEQCADVLKQYGIRKCTADRYAAEFAVEGFREHQITLEHSLKPKSQIYSEFLPLLNSKTCDLLDHARLRTQLIGLERKTARSGKDSIDHGPGGHDDVANAVAGVLTGMGVRKYRYDVTMAWAGTIDAKTEQQSAAAQRLGALVQVQTMRGLLR
ncbi:hypothetical protein JQ628_05015 [Bradyrhizobium lablabi]|uniref:hypothetical protein n=1 Tax=Bradyrhizobium lablabi TaxID=722472 RepID=UPI001BA550FD|nr:hypothetical protein [Bradyrhizobium lablabi]MBR1120869.1 hypothetical protein [Bradyrhizobium lablabi]